MENFQGQKESFLYVPTDSVVPSPYQMRKTFGGPEDEEFDASIAKHGILQPLRVRKNGKPGVHELVFGERRLRGAKKAKFAEVPVILVDLTDDQVIEQLLVENLQRRDIHPLEEGDGYRLLIDKHGYTLDMLIAKTKKSKAHLYGRMKLAKELCAFARKMVVDGKLPIAHAELIVRIGDPQLQEQCAKVVLGRDLHKIFLGDKDGPDAGEDLESSGIKHELVSDDGKYANELDHAQPLSYRATQALIRQRFMTKLALAKFDPNDAKLTSAGACTVCPHRSGNQPGLPGMVDKSDDVCLKPSCFEAKNLATWNIAAAAAEQRGLEVVESKDAGRVFSADGVTIAGDSPYVDLDTPLPYDLDKAPGSKKTFGKLLGKLSAEIPRVLVQDESGAPRELIDKNAAVKKLRELGKIDKPEKPKTSSSHSSARQSPEDAQKQKERDEAKQVVTETALEAVLEKVANAAATDFGKKELAWWRWLASYMVNDGQFGECDVMLARRGLKSPSQLEDLVEKVKNVGELRSIVAEYIVCLVSTTKTGGYAPKGFKDRFDEAMKLAGADWDKTVDAAKDKIKAAQKLEADVDAKIEAAKKPGSKAKPAAKKKGKSK